MWHVDSWDVWLEEAGVCEALFGFRFRCGYGVERRGCW